MTRTTGPGTSCQVDGCDNEVWATGWCRADYQRAWKHGGDPRAGRRYVDQGESLAYYLAHIDDQTDECMIWPYSTSRGYGQLRMGSRGQVTVTILACEHRWGPMPYPRMEAAHEPVTCHNPRCWNPRHLSWKTRQQNMADMRLDGTSTIGERDSMAKLTEAIVQEIREMYASGGITQRELAKRYGITPSNVSCIVRRKSWAHVE